MLKLLLKKKMWNVSPVPLCSILHRFFLSQRSKDEYIKNQFKPVFRFRPISSIVIDKSSEKAIHSNLFAKGFEINRQVPLC